MKPDKKLSRRSVGTTRWSQPVAVMINRRVFIKMLIVLTTVIAVVSAQSVQPRSCNDCMTITSCPEGQELYDNLTPQNREKLKSAYCGFHREIPMLCCSYLSNEDLTKHKNFHLLPKTCGEIDGNRIFGGDRAGLYEFPWMALLSYKKRDRRNKQTFECGGTLINDRYVLTAAHCINKRFLGARIGENDIRTTLDCQGIAPDIKCEDYIQDIHYESYKVHDSYKGKPDIQNDIALVRLSRPVNITKNANVVCLPIYSDARNRNIGDENATVVGWGYTETGYTSPIMLKVKIPVYSHDKCRSTYDKSPEINEHGIMQKKLCAGEVGKDSCGGDSGGPLMVEGKYGERSVNSYVQYGIVSYGPIQCGSNYPGVYTDVTKYLKWILDNISE